MSSDDRKAAKRAARKATNAVNRGQYPAEDAADRAAGYAKHAGATASRSRLKTLADRELFKRLTK